MSETFDVVVVGGGPGGMKAAAVAATRGHQVKLYEARSALGGQVALAQLLPGRAEFGGVTGNLAHETRLAGVQTLLGIEVTRALIDAEAPDVVVLATGHVALGLPLAVGWLVAGVAVAVFLFAS